MKQQITQAIKTGFLKYGLKNESIEKLVSIIEAQLAAKGTIEPENLQAAINEAVVSTEPFVALIQSEVDSRAKKPIIPIPTPAPELPTPADNPENSELLKRLATLEAKDALASKKAATDLLLSDAARLAKGKGAENEKLLSKALKLITVEEGVTAEQISEKLLSEYNDFQSAVSGNGAIPQMPSKTLSNAEIESARSAAVKKSAEAFQKKADNI